MKKKTKRVLTPAEVKERNILLGKIKKVAGKEIDQRLKALNKTGEQTIEKIVAKRIEIFKDLDVDKLKTVINDMETVNDAIAKLKTKSVQTRVGKKETLLQTRLKEEWPNMVKALESGSSRFSISLDTKPEEGGTGKKGMKLDATKVNSTSFGAGVVRGFREAGIDFEQLPELFILDLIQTMSGGPGSNPLTWVERNVAAVGGAGAKLVSALNPTPVLEEATKPQMGFEWVERSEAAKTIAVIVPVTKQSVYNYPQLETEIRFELMRRLAAVLQQQIINGDGVGANLKGINTYATAFAAGNLLNTVVKANQFDVLVAAATQIMLNGFAPNFALVGVESAASMQMLKTDTGTYIMPPFATANGVQVYGMRLIGTREIASDNFLVGDSTKSLFNWVEGINIEVGLINDDFQKNIWRIRGELQGVHRIKNYEAKAFVKGDLSLAAALLDPAVA